MNNFLRRGILKSQLWNIIKKQSGNYYCHSMDNPIIEIVCANPSMVLIIKGNYLKLHLYSLHIYEKSLTIKIYTFAITAIKLFLLLFMKHNYSFEVYSVSKSAASCLKLTVFVRSACSMRERVMGVTPSCLFHLAELSKPLGSFPHHFP